MNTVENRIDQSVNVSNQKEKRGAGHRAKLEELKSALIKRLGAEYAVGTRLVDQAVNEAYALVSSTFVPLLLLPLLAEEKVQSAAASSARQRPRFQESRLALCA
jgi:hypothetical protein